MVAEKAPEEGKPLTWEALDEVPGARGAVNMIYTSLRNAMSNEILVKRLTDREAIVAHIEMTQKGELRKLRGWGFPLSGADVVSLLPKLITESNGILDGSSKRARIEGRGRDVEKFEGLRAANKLLLERIQKTSEPS